MQTPTSTPERTAVAQTLATLDDLSERYRATCHQLALLRAWLADVHADRALREARHALAVEGKNEAERRARLTLAIACDADLRRLDDDERRARQRLAETEAELTVLRWRVQACLALLRGLTGQADATDSDREEETQR